MIGDSLSRIAARDGLSSFSTDDFYYVLDKVSKTPGKLILVGGQALEAWGTQLNVPPPLDDFDEDLYFHALTIDADWLGRAADARYLANLMGVDEAELFVPDPDNPTPNTAILYLQRNGKVKLMDFLSYITGLENDDVHKFAVDFKLDFPGGASLPLRILDPVHCLISRMANLKAYDSKRTGNGIKQAKWAVDILKAYLIHLVIDRKEDPKIIRQQCSRIFTAAEFGDSAKFCFVNYQINPIEAIDPLVVKACGSNFETKDWVFTTQRIKAKQDKWHAESVKKSARLISSRAPKM